mmetsp:Transcript_51621/g.71677  ORF Transcript_51621/g.71677 Transcript_51621/m.71677 type:complete len:163 (+) Transcript_51621:606-1094(+)
MRIWTHSIWISISVTTTCLQRPKADHSTTLARNSCPTVDNSVRDTFTNNHCAFCCPNGYTHCSTHICADDCEPNCTPHHTEPNGNAKYITHSGPIRSTQHRPNKLPDNAADSSPKSPTYCFTNSSSFERSDRRADWNTYYSNTNLFTNRCTHMCHIYKPWKW